MTKEIRCGDLMPGCDHVIRAESENEVMRKAAAHAEESHGMTIDRATAEKVRSAIREA